MLAHVGGVPVEESLLYVAPVVIVVGWLYYSGRRERRRRDPGAEPPAERVRGDDAAIR